MKKLIVKLIDFYRVLFSFDKGILAIFCPGGACKQTPTCSLYTKEMVLKYGVLKGLILGGKRILSCR